MSQRLQDKVALITGGASGIGRECALKFAVEGASVVVADLNPERAAAVVDEAIAEGGQAIGIGVDISQPEEVSSMIKGAVENFGRIDVCVAAAGISHAAYVSREPDEQATADRYDKGDMLLLNKSLESWQRVIDVNLTGVMLTNQAVANQMIKTGGGAIVNIASVAARTALMGSSDYCVSKAGVWMLTKCGAIELARHNIRVNAVGPGYIRTSMSGAATNSEAWVTARTRETPLRRLGEPSDIANACLYLCSDESSFVTGEIIFPDGGIMADSRA
tara:strand:- start:510 stop:1334 length:825 start_codon:yes stop_codon:yes gene_type:complete